VYPFQFFGFIDFGGSQFDAKQFSVSVTARQKVYPNRLSVKFAAGIPTTFEI
jgi:hypothetical protein